jgi:hypothetical protein
MERDPQASKGIYNFFKKGFCQVPENSNVKYLLTGERCVEEKR